MHNKPELLAPAGDLDRLKTALRFGADAVYLGGPLLQLRAGSAGFSMEDVEKAVHYTHEKGKRLYVAVNSFMKNSEIPALKNYARTLKGIGVDAVIVSDIGAIATVRRAAPELEVHVSTQANCINYAACEHYYEMGASRVILGREATLEEVAEICSRAPKGLQIECFVHGAMCMSYSGRCLLSAYMRGRSGNRGDCFQPCRHVYTVQRWDEENEYYPIIEDAEGTTLLSSRDLNCLPFLDDLIGAGVHSLKIEGRMKTAYYVATVVNAYRHALDGTADRETCLKELDCASHREYTSGFYFGEAISAPAAGKDYLQDCVFIANVLKEENGRYILEQRNRFSVGDELEILSPNSMGKSFTVTDMQNADGEAIDVAPVPLMQVSVSCPEKLESGDILRRRV